MYTLDADLVDDLGDVVGDGLRTVATYDRGEYELQFIREDVGADYTDSEIANVYEQVEIEGMGYDHFEELFHVGDLECAMYGFESALMFQFPRDSFTGLFITVDRDVTINPDAVISVCTRAMGLE